MADEDYGDYVTRCVCGYTHDDGYMICCDVCSVWQHVECMKVDPKNLPEKYLCEKCNPRPVDKKRARALQMKKRDELSDVDEEDVGSVSNDDGRRSSSSSPLHSVHQLQVKRRRKQQQRLAGSTRVQELKVEASRKVGRKEKSDKEKEDGKKGKRKVKVSPHQSSPGLYSPLLSGVQTLLSAASALEEQQQDSDIWNCFSSPWSDPYEECRHNMYSESLSGPFPLSRSEGLVYSAEEYVTLEARVSQPLCVLKEVGQFRKGLVAASGLTENSLVMEYKGHVSLKSELSGGRFLWKHSPCPFVYQYGQLEVCIDARKTGNLARFVRRSCSPNTEMRHFFVNDNLHFGLYTISSVVAGDEITLPFDFRYDKCEYSVECACGNPTRCNLARSPGVIKRKSSRTSSTEDDHGQRSASKTPCLLSTHTLDEDSNSSWTSSGSHRKRVRQLHVPARLSREQATDSDSEEHDEGEIKKAKSREERKTEAVWRMFEKMEASERRRHHLLSESSQDGEHSPSTQRMGKERRTSVSSTGSKKSHILPTSKLTLSTELLSPEPMDAFSPPLTPSLTSSLTNIPADTASSPSPSYSHSTTKLGFEVTPYLHPKYLLADFALPRKKAILQQWESELMKDGGEGESQYIVVNGTPHWAQNGYAIVSGARSDNDRPRIRGCLKHRWMKQHEREEDSRREEEMNAESRQNGTTESDSTGVHHKKRLLHRWLERYDKEEEEEKGEHDTKEATKEEHVHEEDHDKPSSPLFDDFSDDDFDEMHKPRVLGDQHVSVKGVRNEREKREGSSEAMVEKDNVECKEELMDDAHLLVTPPPSPPPSVVISSESTIQDQPCTVAATNQDAAILSPSPAVSTVHPLPSVVEPELESLNDSKEGGNKEEQNEDVREIPVDRKDEVEMDISSPPPPKTTVAMTTDITSPLPMVYSADSLLSVSDDASSDKLSCDPSDCRPAGKRKMSLLEYRSRAKRPGISDGKKASLPPILTERSSVSSPSSSSTSSLLSPSVSFLSFSSSFLSGSSRRASQPPPPPPPATTSSTSTGSSPSLTTMSESLAPSHFEPVSPDDDTPPAQGTNEASLPQSSPSSATPLSSSQPLPVSSVGHKTLLMSPNTTTMAHTPPHGYHGPPISAVRSGPFMMDSRWPTQTATTVDVQDPRRAIHHPVDSYPHPPPPPHPLPPPPPPPPPLDAQFPQYSVRTHHTAPVPIGLLPHPTGSILQPSSVPQHHPPPLPPHPPGGYIVFHPPNHPHSTTYH